jgi:hypothetical protein
VDQIPEPQFALEKEPVGYTVLGASNVIPLLPLQSPKRVPDTGAAAPAMVMSRKSMSVRDATAAQVSVRVVPRELDCTNVRTVASAPAESVKVPVIVWSAPNDTTLILEVVKAENDKLLNVLTPRIDIVDVVLAVKLTL